MSLLPLDTNVNPSRTLFAKYTGESSMSFSTLTGVSTINGSASLAGSSSTGPTGVAGPQGFAGPSAPATATGATGFTGPNGLAAQAPVVDENTQSRTVASRTNGNNNFVIDVPFTVIGGKSYLISVMGWTKVVDSTGPPLPGDCVGLIINTNVGGGVALVGPQTYVSVPFPYLSAWQAQEFTGLQGTPLNLTVAITPNVTQTITQFQFYTYLQNGSQATYQWTPTHYVVANLN